MFTNCTIPQHRHHPTTPATTSFENDSSSTIRNIMHLKLISQSSSSDDKLDGYTLDQVNHSKNSIAGKTNIMVDTPANNMTPVRQSEKNARFHLAKVENQCID